MSDNEDLLGDDLGDQSLADYNLGNEEEEQLLADDYENAAPQNVPTSIGPAFREPIDNMVPQPQEYPVHEYGSQPIPYQPVVDTECVVPNITVEVANAPARDHSTYAPYEAPVYEEHAVPPAIPAGPVESPQIVPSDVITPISNGSLSDMGDLGARERFISERPPGVQRMPQVRDIPDSLDKVVIPRGGWGGPGSGGRGRTSWRSTTFQARQPHPYRRNNMHRGNFNQRTSFPPPQIRPNPPQMRPDIRPEMNLELRPELRPEIPPQLLRPDIRMEPNIPPQMGPEISPERPILPQEMPMFRPPIERPQFLPRFQYRQGVEERPQFGPRPNFDPHFFRPSFPPRQFAPPMREIVSNPGHIPQVTIRQSLPVMPGPSLDKMGPKVDLLKEPEVRMLPVSLPPNLPPGGLAGKKVLINPHFKGTFQPPVEGPVKDIDDAAERFIAEQRNALARAAVRKHTRRSPQRYIENTTIEIENELAHTPYRRNDDDDLLRRQEEFINANRAGLRRRMRTPSPPRRSPSPRRSPLPERERGTDRDRGGDRERRPRPEETRHYDEDSDYKRRLREQESLRERVLRAKEVRRRKNAVALHKQLQEKERETQESAQKPEPKPEVPPVESSDKPTSTEQDNKPDTTRTTPDKENKTTEIIRDRSPVKEVAQVNSTVENLTPPRRMPVKQESPERALTPPLPGKKDDKRTDSDDDLDLILGDIDGILSDDDDTGRFKEKAKKSEPTKSKPQVDLRSKLPPKTSSSHESKKPQRQKIVFNEEREEKRKRAEKSPPRRAVVTSSTKSEDTENIVINKKVKAKAKLDNLTVKSRQRITYENKEAEKESEDKKSSFSNRRVILQRKDAGEAKATAGIFSRAVRTALAPHVHFDSDSSGEEGAPAPPALAHVAAVANLPPAITATRLRTLAGPLVQVTPPAG
ncbi:unnamed protein product [Arctia plantaginis]|uniref:Uncharacterized protein n=1 Tax=Arctia plantaginis TaxID=874455 RepID=A0A8S1A3D8_ARCPL|nr:unnamed protein product [Arctia plantaginis]